jgi:hypothetical protein
MARQQRTQHFRGGISGASRWRSFRWWPQIAPKSEFDIPSVSVPLLYGRENFRWSRPRVSPISYSYVLACGSRQRTCCLDPSVSATAPPWPQSHFQVAYGARLFHGILLFFRSGMLFVLILCRDSWALLSSPSLPGSMPVRNRSSLGYQQRRMGSREGQWS